MTAPSIVWYFAYGSNLQAATLRGRRGIDYQRAVPVRVRGWRLVFDKPPLFPAGTSVANIVEDADAEVLGVAFAMSADDHAHVELTEGVGFGNYRRVEVQVEPLAPTVDAPTVAYSLSSEKRAPGLQPSTRYMALVIEGAVEHGLPDVHLDLLRQVEACQESAAAAALRPVLDEFFKRR
jgi:hypothetical protein